jgi:hypothetical protein
MWPVMNDEVLESLTEPLSLTASPSISLPSLNMLSPSLLASQLL